MTPPAEEIAALVEGLGTRQREVLLRCGRTPRRATDFSGSVAAGMRFSKGDRPPLTDRHIRRDHGRRTAWYFLTEAGLALRARLIAQQEK